MYCPVERKELMPVKCYKPKTIYIMETLELREKEHYVVYDYANDVFGEVEIISSDHITGEIVYREISTDEIFHFSGQGFFDSIKS